METRLIKTCHGLTELRFLDGALLPADGASIVEVCEARMQEAENYLDQQAMKHLKRWLTEPFFWMDQRQ